MIALVQSKIAAPEWLNSPIFDVHLFTVSGTPITVTTLIVFGIALVATFIFSWLVRRPFTRWFLSKRLQDEGSLQAIDRLMHYLLLTVGFSVALQIIGIDLTTLFAAGAIFAVGIGFAMQNIMQNFVSGVILLVERSITQGDIIQVNNQLVRVEKLGIRATIARTLGDEDLIIPNSELIQSVVTNHTLTDKLFRIEAVVGVVYESDLDQVMKVLQEAANKTERSQKKDPAVVLFEFGDNAVILKVYAWVETPWEANRTRSQLNLNIWNALRAEKITIAFPQLDVHFDEAFLKSHHNQDTTEPS